MNISIGISEGPEKFYYDVTMDDTWGLTQEKSVALISFTSILEGLRDLSTERTHSENLKSHSQAIVHPVFSIDFTGDV